MVDEVIEGTDYRFPMITWNGNSTSFTCDTIGVAGTTPIFLRRIPTGRIDFPWKYEARMGIAILGSVNDPDCYNKSPFSEDWRDNYVHGVHCASPEAAVKKMVGELKSVQDSLWV